MRRLKHIAVLCAVLLSLSHLELAQANQKSHQVTMQVPSIAVLALSGGNITLALEAPAMGGDTR